VRSSSGVGTGARRRKRNVPATRGVGFGGVLYFFELGHGGFLSEILMKYTEFVHGTLLKIDEMARSACRSARKFRFEPLRNTPGLSATRLCGCWRKSRLHR
jgi:hypothetical protein